MDEIKKIIEEINKAFLEHKTKNDQRLAEIEKKGHADPLLEEQVTKIAGEIQNLEEMKKKIEDMEVKLARPGFNNPENKNDPENKAKADAQMKYLRFGDGKLSAEEVKLLSTDSDPQGGYYVRPERSNQIIELIRETSPMRTIATVENISGNALEIPDDLGEANAAWTSEQAARPETATPTIGIRTITPQEMYAKPKATQTLLDDSSVDVEAWLGRKVADKFSRLENAAFINGDGVGKPRGILTYPAGSANPKQIQQIVSGSAAALTADGLRSVKYGLKSHYLQNARWLTSRNAVEAISKLKDSNGQYLWQPSLQLGQAQTLLGHPLESMEDMPVVAAGSLSIAFGDLRQGYTIVDRMGIRVLRDPFSAKPFIEFYHTKRTGGDVTNFEAFVLQKTSA